MREIEKDIAAAVAQAVGNPPEPARVAIVGAGPDRKPLAWYAGVVAASSAVLVGAGFLTASLFQPDGSRSEARAGARSEIRIGRVDLPDLKDGVPQITSAATPIRAIPLTPASAASAAVPSASSPFAGAPTGPSRTDAPAQTASTEPTIRSLVATPGAAPPPAAPLPVIRTTSTTLAVPQPPAKAPVAAPAAQAAASASATPVPMPPVRVVAPIRVLAVVDAPAAPLPPTAPARTAGVQAPVARVRPPIVAAAPQPKPVKPATVVAENPADPTTTAAIGATKPPREEEHYDVLGLKVPTLGATANRIRDGVSAIGNAVTSLPDRF